MHCNIVDVEPTAAQPAQHRCVGFHERAVVRAEKSNHLTMSQHSLAGVVPLVSAPLLGLVPLLVSLGAAGAGIDAAGC
jgi:hypothetical protein